VDGLEKWPGAAFDPPTRNNGWDEGELDVERNWLDRAGTGRRAMLITGEAEAEYARTTHAAAIVRRATFICMAGSRDDNAKDGPRFRNDMEAGKVYNLRPRKRKGLLFRDASQDSAAEVPVAVLCGGMVCYWFALSCTFARDRCGRTWR
jgi:hypothetical protein